VTFTAEQRCAMLRQMHHDQIGEAVIVQTCNRLEFYLYAKKAFDCRGFLGGLLASYGTGAVARYGGVPPYAETQAYVAKVQALYARYQVALDGKSAER
jgi:hypothetical protein